MRYLAVVTVVHKSIRAFSKLSWSHNDTSCTQVTPLIMAFMPGAPVPWAGSVGTQVICLGRSELANSQQWRTILRYASQ